MGSVSTVFLENRQGVKFGTAVHNTKGILDYVHTDVWGPSKNESIGGNRWFVTFIDDFSRRVWVYMMKHKDEVLDIFLKWKKMVETQTGRRVKTLRSDNGGELKGDNWYQSTWFKGVFDFCSKMKVLKMVF